MAIRQILLEWAAIDWFVPPRDDEARFSAMRLFGQHTALARAHLPRLFPASVEMRPARGGFREFAAFCERVQATSGSWDWKFSALKALSCIHSEAHGWTLEAEAKNCVSVEGGVLPRTGDLFVRFGESVMWGQFHPTFDLSAALPRDHVSTAGWYLSYASMDIVECIEWQLAGRSDRLEGNPFVPLMRCYAAGYYPFSLGPDLVILFAFTG